MEAVVSKFAALWQPAGQWKIDAPKGTPHEAQMLALDSSLARKELGWKPSFTLDEALAHTAHGYSNFCAGMEPQPIMRHMLGLCGQAIA